MTCLNTRKLSMKGLNIFVISAIIVLIGRVTWLNIRKRSTKELNIIVINIKRGVIGYIVSKDAKKAGIDIKLRY